MLKILLLLQSYHLERHMDSCRVPRYLANFSCKLTTFEPKDTEKILGFIPV